MESQLILSLTAGIFIGGAAGYLGSLMLSKRMALVAGPLGHLTLPGIALALLYGFDVSFGYYSQMRAHTYFPDYLWLNDQKVEYPQNAGFDMAKRYLQNRNPPENYNTYDENGDIYIEELQDPRGWVYSVNEIENVALEFIRDNKDNPFFLYYPSQLPHSAQMVDNIGELGKLEGVPLPVQEWAAMVVRLDKSVGKLVGELKNLGIYENTIIFFASDNGYTSNDEWY